MSSCSKLIFRLHALSRMVSRGFTPDDVRKAVGQGALVENYPDDYPYPSFLVLAWIGRRPVHIVVAYNEPENETIIITVYEPDSSKWHDGFTRRRL